MAIVAGKGDRTPWLDIVIVNWNSLEHLQRCIASVRAGVRDGFELARIAVVDNGSRDGSVAWIAAQPDCLLVANEFNRGFATACNQGAALGQGHFVLFLNPDVILDPDALARAVGWFETAPANVGIVGIRLRDRDGDVQRSCARFPTFRSMAGQCAGLDRLLPGWFPPHFLDEPAGDIDREVDQVMGAFFLVRRTVFDAMGGFDEQFFLYYEDLDFSLRARQGGWCSMSLAAPGAVHAGGGTTEGIPARRLFYRLRSRIVYCRKHFSSGATLVLLVLTLGIEPLARLVHGFRSSGVNGMRQVLAAYARLVKSLPVILATSLTPPRPALTPQVRRRRLRAVQVPAAPAGTAPTEVLLFTMGKVGTTTMQKALGDCGVLVHKAHCIDAGRLGERIDRDRRRARVLKTDLVARDIATNVLPHMDRVPTITLVREVIGRNMSGFFETLWRRGIHPPYDHVDIQALCLQFLEQFNHERPDQWFQQEFGPSLGIEPFPRDFDPVQGHGRARAGKFDILLMQLEIGNDALGSLVGDFLGVLVPIRSRHQSRNKVYGELYAKFKRRIRFPDEFLCRVMDGQVMRNFYSMAQREHIMRFYKREVPVLYPLPRC